MDTKTFTTKNPVTNKELTTYDYMTPSEVEKNIATAFQFYHENIEKTLLQKSQTLIQLAAEFRRKSADLAKMITTEMGKPIKDSIAEIEKSAKGYEYISENLEKFMATEIVKSSYPKSQIVKDPIGPILAIMPWNFPVWQTTRFAAPAVGIGNPILLKHSNVTTGTAQMMTDIVNSVCPGMMYNLRINHEQVSTLIGDSRVRAVTLTGSTQAGRDVAAAAGKYLKKSVLELGGSDAYIVFADANIKNVAKICAIARMTNNGQSCISAKRFLVEKSVLESFIKYFIEELRQFQHGDPLDIKTNTGPLASKKFQTQLLSQCENLEKQGAEKIFDLAVEKKFEFKNQDAYFPARAYLVNKSQSMVFTEEFFGPVALILSFDTEIEALELSNRSVFGLGGAVFSENILKAETFSRKLEAGFISINEQVKSDSALPFGGVKDSGYGRELGLHGFNEFCNIKTLATTIHNN